MRNKTCLPETLVPKQKRLAVYKQAVEHIKTKSCKHLCGTNQPHLSGLCLLLPCILWDLNHYADRSPSGVYWSYYDTSKMFPELTEEDIISITSITYCGEDTSDKQRIKLLKKYIRKLSK